MADEVRADPTELARLAGTTLTASGDLADAWRTVQPELAVPAAAFGNLPAGQGVHRTHQAATGDGGTGVDRLVAVHEGDVDRLYRVSFAYQQADREAAARARRAGRSGPGGPQAE